MTFESPMESIPHALRLLARSAENPRVTRPPGPLPASRPRATGVPAPFAPAAATPAAATPPPAAIDPFALHRAARRWRSRALSVLMQRQLRRLLRQLRQLARLLLM